MCLWLSLVSSQEVSLKTFTCVKYAAIHNFFLKGFRTGHIQTQAVAISTENISMHEKWYVLLKTKV